ncbi:hypothetical protein C7212DRAFT_332612, partial [Tuber magnatum]
MGVRVCGWRVEKKEERKGRVDWDRFKAELKITEKSKGWEERLEKQRNREELEKQIVEVEGWIKGRIEECRERRKDRRGIQKRKGETEGVEDKGEKG